jgi:hypothetical protein
MRAALLESLCGDPLTLTPSTSTSQHKGLPKKSGPTCEVQWVQQRHILSYTDDAKGGRTHSATGPSNFNNLIINIYVFNVQSSSIFHTTQRRNLKWNLSGLLVYQSNRIWSPNRPNPPKGPKLVEMMKPLRMINGFVWKQPEIFTLMISALLNQSRVYLYHSISFYIYIYIFLLEIDRRFVWMRFWWKDFCWWKQSECSSPNVLNILNVSKSSQTKWKTWKQYDQFKQRQTIWTP